MHILERILLYAVSLASITLLFRSESAPAKPASTLQNDFADPSLELSELEDANFAASQSTQNPASARSKFNRSAGTSNSLVLRDRHGRPRLEFKIGPHDEPQLLLNDKVGRAMISLKVDENGTARMMLRHHSDRLEIGPDEKGDLAVVLQGAEQEEIRLTLSEDGEAKLMAKGRSPSTLALSSRANGTADIQIHRGAGTGGPLMSVQQNGEAAIGIAGNDREYGPVMHLFEDGLGQFSINGPGSSSGPTLIRTPDGTAIISVRHPNGQPAASMVASPTGTSVLAVTNTAGTQQAALRAEQNGKVGIGVTENKSEEKPAPKPLPKPPKAPTIELIQHQPAAPGEVFSLSFPVAELSSASK